MPGRWCWLQQVQAHAGARVSRLTLAPLPSKPKANGHPAEFWITSPGDTKERHGWSKASRSAGRGRPGVQRKGWGSDPKRKRNDEDGGEVWTAEKAGGGWSGWTDCELGHPRRRRQGEREPPGPGVGAAGEESGKGLAKQSVL